MSDCSGFLTVTFAGVRADGLSVIELTQPRQNRFLSYAFILVSRVTRIEVFDPPFVLTERQTLL